MATSINFKRGDQIIYIPDHADTPGHPDCEPGFVTSITQETVFCRYWNKYNPVELRTTANSESTSPRNLIKVNTKFQSQIDRTLKGLGYEI